MFSYECSVATMQYDISVLRAIVRLARRRFPADVSAIHLRVSGGERDVRDALARLEARGLIERHPHRVAPTMMGLAIAVATLPAIKQRTFARRRRIAA
jgi:Mn-dependent DtxR family transcriptional regulator